MTEEADINSEGIERVALKEFTEQAYLNYSMYVILDRALPHIGDGLKPVQRRIIYAMSELGLKYTAKYKKSARTVGDVLGKFHPHGDSACYEAMVLMAQPFSYRHPLIDGQGNWGAADDPKSFAAMRYTESRLSAYADLLLSELGQGTVDWKPNFDGTLEEPEIFPARLPNLLLNGTTGIAVGMATDIPPHNIGEVVNACIRILDKPETTLEDLYSIISGPDFPTEAELVSPVEEIRKIYATGHGTLRLRAIYDVENGEIVITSLPHQVSGAKLLEQLGNLMQAKKLPMVMDLRDESDHENPTRLIIIPRSNRVDIEGLMAHLFAATDLERTYRVNMNIVGLNGRPQVKNLLTILQEWLEFRKITVRKRLQYRLEKVSTRLHLLEGYVIAFHNLDRIIEIIRTEDHPKSKLMEELSLSEKQADSILDLRLRFLAKLEEKKIQTEQKELSEERKKLEKILASEMQLKKLIRSELIADSKNFGNERRTRVVERQEARKFTHDDLTPSEPITVILSEMGWIRAAKGHDINLEKLPYKAGDKLQTILSCRSNQMICLFDNTGRFYSFPGHSLPSARSHGEPLTGRLNMPPRSKALFLLRVDPEKKYFLSSNAGFGFIISGEELETKNKAGKVVLTLTPLALPMRPIEIRDLENDLVVTINNEGRMLVFPLSQLPTLPKGKGNLMLRVTPDRFERGEEKIIFSVIVSADKKMVLMSGKRKQIFTYSELEIIKSDRGRRGQLLTRNIKKVSAILIN